MPLFLALFFIASKATAASTILVVRAMETAYVAAESRSGRGRHAYGWKGV